MTTVHAIVESKRAEIAELCRRLGVVRLDVFGSATSDRFDQATSDVDFVVEFNGTSGLGPFREYFALKNGLEQLLGRPVDLIDRSAIENPYFRERVEQTQELVYAS